MKIKLREATEEPKITAFSIAQFEAERLGGKPLEIDDNHSAVEFEFKGKFYNIDIRLKELGDSIQESTDGTQVDDIEKKEDYPQFKLGKRISNLIEDEVLNNLEPEEKQKAVEIYNGRIIKGYKCTNCKRTIPNITFFDKKAYKDRTEYFCPFCNEPYDFKDLEDIELKEYNFIGKDAGKEGIHKNTHIETIYTLYDKYGEIGEYKTYEEAKKDMDEWYNDPELYPDGEMGLHIEGPEEIEVSNNKIVVKDDLS